MIYQPTNVTPDLLGGVENGVVFIQSGSGGTVTVSWQVNGNTPLYAYQIDFFQMDAESTAAGSTGKVNVVPAFSGVDAYGNLTRFSVDVPYSLFSGAATAENNYEGKFQITQWYNSARTESVVQRSMSVFRLAGTPSVSVTQISGEAGIYSFAGGAFIPSGGFQPVSVEWTRWYVMNETRNRIEQDTGKVYGATGVTAVWKTDRLNPGDAYHAVYAAGFSTGYEAAASSGSFTAMEGYVSAGGGISVSCDRQKGAVRLDVIPFEDFSADVAGSFSWSDNGKLVLPLDASAKWTPPSLSDSQWNFLWQASIDELDRRGTSDSQLLFRVRQRDGTVFSAVWYEMAQTVVFTPSIPGEGGIQWADGDRISILLSMDNGVFTFSVAEKISGGSVYSYSTPVSGYVSAPISSMEIGGGTTTDFWAVTYGPEAAALNTAFENWEAPVLNGPHLLFDGEDYAAPDEVNGTANYFDAGADWTMFRRDGDGNVALVTNFEYAVDVVPVTVWDYGAVNGNTYVYYIVSQGDSSAYAYVTETEAVTPCFWDWALVQAQVVTDLETVNIGGRYTAVQAFLFSGNVTTGQTGNGNSPSVQSTFTRYPVVMRDTQNRQAGTLTGLIGAVQAGVYSDSNEVREALWGLSTSPLPLFLRSRRGDFLRVALTGEIGMQTADNSAKQELTATVPWVEIGPVQDTVAGLEYSQIDPPGNGGDNA